MPLTASDKTAEAAKAAMLETRTNRETSGGFAPPLSQERRMSEMDKIANTTAPTVCVKTHTGSVKNAIESIPYSFICHTFYAARIV